MINKHVMKKKPSTTTLYLQLILETCLYKNVLSTSVKAHASKLLDLIIDICLVKY